MFGGSGNDLLEGDGGVDAVWGGDGNDTLVGGEAIDFLWGESGNDELHGESGDDELHGGLGKDTLFGGEGADIIHGEAEEDELHGGSGNDTIIGDNGDDILHGDSGSDTFFAEEGNDTFDGGTGFETDIDRLDYSPVNFLFTEVVLDENDAPMERNLGMMALGDQIKFGLSGEVYTDTFTEIETLIGTQFSDIFKNVDVDAVYGGSGNDFINQPDIGRNLFLAGEAGKDTIFGGSGDDLISGGADNDLLEGGAGKDTIDGGSGFDSVIYGRSETGVAVDLRGGLASSDGYSDASIDSLISIEGVVGSDHADVLHTQDRKDGTYSTAQGGEGNDTIYGHGYRSKIYGNEGDDTLYGRGTSGSMVGTTTHIYGGHGNDTIYGNTDNGSDGTIHGDAGEDMIYAHRGQFNIDGGADADFIHAGSYTYAHPTVVAGGTGADVFFLEDSLILTDFEAGRDFIVFNTEGVGTPEFSQSGNDVVLTYHWKYGYECDIRIKNITVSELNGSYSVGTKADALAMFQERRSLDVDGTDGDDYLVGGMGDDIVTAGDGSDFLEGYSGNDILDAGEGDDDLVGGGGDDVMTGGAGNDTFYTNIPVYGWDARAFGNDVITDFGVGEDSWANDRILIDMTNFTETAYQGYEIDGNDTVLTFVFGDGELNTLRLENYIMQEWDVRTNTSQMIIDGYAYNRFSHDTLVGTDGNDGLDGGFGDDLLTGLGGDDFLYGGSGADSLDGGDGIDVLYGDEGNDTLAGGAGDDELFGHTGDDIIDGGDGDDEIEGGSGNDLLTGGSGHDTFTFEIHDRGDGTFEGFGDNVITDFAAEVGGQMVDRLEINYWGLPETTFQGFEIDGVDTVLTFAFGEGETSTIRLENYIMQEWDAWAGADRMIIDGYAYNHFSHDTLVGTDGNDGLDGGAGDDMLIGLGGDDFLYGSTGSDTLDGGAGDDDIDGGNGSDLLTGGSGDDMFRFALWELQDGSIEGFGQDVITDFGDGTSSSSNDRVTVDFWGLPETSFQDFEILGADTVLTFGHGAGETSTVLLKDYWVRDDDIWSFSDSMYVDGYAENRVINDSLTGSDQSDQIDGFAGDDLLFGLAGDDAIFGGRGDDMIEGGEGDDFIVGGSGDDHLLGGAGVDTFLFEEDFGHDVLADFGTGDVIEVMTWDMSFEGMVLDGFDTALTFSRLDATSGQVTNSTLTLENYELDSSSIVDDGYSIRIEEMYL